MTLGKLVGTVATECCCQEIAVSIIIECTAEVRVELVAILVTLGQVDVGTCCRTGNEVGYGVWKITGVAGSKVLPIALAHFLTSHYIDIMLLGNSSVIGQDVAPRPVLGIVLVPGTIALWTLAHAKLIVWLVCLCLVEIIICRKLSLQGKSLQESCFQISINTEVESLGIVGLDFCQSYCVVWHPLVVWSVITTIWIAHGNRRLRLQCGHDDVPVFLHFLLWIREWERNTALEPFLEFGINVTTQGLALEACLQTDTSLVEVAGRNSVGSAAVTTRKRKTVVGHEGCTEQFVLPVSTIAEKFRAQPGAGCWFDLGIRDSIVVLSILLQVHHVKFLRHSLPTHITIVGYLSLTILTTLGGNHDDTIRCAWTIDSGSRSILQNIHSQDIARVDACQWVGISIVRTIWVDDDTIDNKDRLGGGIQRVRTADADGTTTTRSTCVGLNLHTGSTTLENLVDTRCDWFLKSFVVYLGNRTGQIGLAHGTITYYHHLAESLGVGYQSYINRTIANFHLLIFIAKIRNL